jgi:hypothetical protein
MPSSGALGPRASIFAASGAVQLQILVRGRNFVGATAILKTPRLKIEISLRSQSQLLKVSMLFFSKGKTPWPSKSASQSIFGSARPNRTPKISFAS